MNMISTGAFLNEMDASNKQPTAAEKFAAVWEKKNAKAAQAGGVSLMALSLAACGSSSTTPTTPTTDTTTTTTVTPIASALTVGSDDIDGTSGNDSVTGARIDNVQTLNNGDTVDLGEGTDTLSANLNGGTVTPTSITGVETITLSAVGTAASTIDMDNVSGVTSLQSNGSSQALTFDDIQALTDVSVTNATAATTFTFKTAALSAADQSITVNLDGTQGNVQIGSEADTDGDIETLTIVNGAGASDLGTGALMGADATSLTINATGALDLGSTAAFGKALTVNMAGSTGGVTIGLAGHSVASVAAAHDITITGGAGGDTVDITGFDDTGDHDDVVVNLGAGNDTLLIGDLAYAGVEADMVADGGDGDDTLNIESTITLGTYTNFEKIEFNVTATDAQDIGEIDGTINYLIVDGTTEAAGDVLTWESVVDGTTIEIDDAVGAGTGFIGEIDLKFENAGTNSATVVFDLAEAGGLADIKSSTGRMTELTLSNNTSYTATVTDILTASNTGLVELNVVGSGDTTVTNAVANTITLIDASTATGDVNVKGGAGAVVFKGGSGADTYTVNASSTGDTVTGGAGDDTFSSDTSTGAVTIAFTGGAGKDTITLDNDSTGATIEQVKYTASTDGSGIVTITNTGTAADDITVSTTADDVNNFDNTTDAGADLVVIGGALQTALNAKSGGTDDTEIILADNGGINYNSGTVFVFHADDDLAGDNFGDMSDVITTFNVTNSGTNTNAAANQEILFSLSNNSGSETGLYYFKDVNGDGDISVGDQIALLAVFDVDAGAFTATEIAFA